MQIKIRQIWIEKSAKTYFVILSFADIYIWIMVRIPDGSLEHVVQAQSKIGLFGGGDLICDCP